MNTKAKFKIGDIVEVSPASHYKVGTIRRVIKIHDRDIDGFFYCLSGGPNLTFEERNLQFVRRLPMGLVPAKECILVDGQNAIHVDSIKKHYGAEGFKDFLGWYSGHKRIGIGIVAMPDGTMGVFVTDYNAWILKELDTTSVCQDCHGTGIVPLLTSTVRCKCRNVKMGKGGH